MEALYTAVGTASSGRDGRVASDDSIISLPLAMPKSMGGAGGNGTNPEQLFACGYAACFGSALKLVAARKKLPVTKVEITAKVGIGKKGEGFGLVVELIGVMGGVAMEQAKELMQAAHQVCPYSNAIRGNVEVMLTVA